MTGRSRTNACLALIAVCVVALGCSSATPTAPTSASATTPSAGGQPSPQATATGAAGEAAVAAARAQIETASLGNPASLVVIDATLRFTDVGAQAARSVLEAGAADDALWIALWVYASAGSDAAPLRPLVDQADPSLRAMAAATLIAFGDSGGFEALRSLLGEESPLRGADPPRSVSAYVVTTLQHYVTETGVPVAAGDEFAQAAANWQAWLATHAAELQFDDATGVWSPL